MHSKNISAGLLLYRRVEFGIEVFLIHPGGPFFTQKDKGFWSVPKGLPEDGEELQLAARREFAEEVGFEPEGELIELGSIKQKGGKTVYGWAVEGHPPPNWQLKSNLFPAEWPPRSGKWNSFPEVDKAQFFSENDALEHINEAQRAFIHRLKEILETRH